MNEFRRDKPPGRSYAPAFFFAAAVPFHGRAFARNSVELHILPYGNILNGKEEIVT